MKAKGLTKACCSLSLVHSRNIKEMYGRKIPGAMAA